MDVWLSVLAFVLFLGFGTGVLVCISAMKRQTGILVKSRLHHKLNISEVIYANLGLVGLVVLVWFKIYMFVPAVLMFVLFIVLSTRIQSGITKEGVLVGSSFIEWEFMRSYLLENQGEDSNVIVLKIRANRKTYILVCNREDRFAIDEIFQRHNVRKLKNLQDGHTSWNRTGLRMQQENVQGAIPEQYRIADARMQLEKCTGRNPGETA